jgi:hypothetical protein
LYPKPYEPGSSLGQPNQPQLQTRILHDVLGLLHYPAEPGTIIVRDYST